MRIYNFILFVFILLLTGCQPHPQLTEAEKLMETNENAALELLQTIDVKSLHSPSDRAYHAILLSQALLETNREVSDSVISIATEYYNDNDPESAALAWLLRSRIAIVAGDEELGAKALLKSQHYALKAQSNTLLAQAYSDKSIIFQQQNELDSALKYCKIASGHFKTYSDNYNYVVSQLREAFLLSQLGQNKAAFSELQNLKKYHIKNDTVLLSAYYRTLCAVYYADSNFVKAIEVCKKTPRTSELNYDDNNTYLIAKCYVHLAQYDSAIYYQNKMQYKGEMAVDYYLLYNDIFTQRKDYKTALKYALMAYHANDSLNKRHIDQSITAFERRFNYQRLELENSELHLRNSNDSVVILICLLLITVSTTLFFLYQNQLRKKQINTEKQLLDVEIKRANKEYENKMLLQRQLSLQDILFKNLEQYRINAHKKSHEIKEGFSPVNNEHFYQQLFTTIDLAYSDFSKRLKERYASLTDTDIFICCLLLAGYDTGVIASLLQVKSESMNVRRSRLRKKLELKNETDLLNFLQNF